MILLWVVETGMGAEGMNVGAVGGTDTLNSKACSRRILFLYSLVLKSPNRELNTTVHYKIHQPVSRFEIISHTFRQYRSYGAVYQRDGLLCILWVL